MPDSQPQPSPNLPARGEPGAGTPKGPSEQSLARLRLHMARLTAAIDQYTAQARAVGEGALVVSAQSRGSPRPTRGPRARGFMSVFALLSESRAGEVAAAASGITGPHPSPLTWAQEQDAAAARDHVALQERLMRLLPHLSDSELRSVALCWGRDAAEVARGSREDLLGMLGAGAR